MGFVYKRAGLEDIELLVKSRIEVLRAANRLDDDVEMSPVEQQSREYYEEYLRTGEHISLEATDMGRPLYERYGFVGMKDEMKLPEESW